MLFPSPVPKEAGLSACRPLSPRPLPVGTVLPVASLGPAMLSARMPVSRLPRTSPREDARECRPRAKGTLGRSSCCATGRCLHRAHG